MQNSAPNIPSQAAKSGSLSSSGTNSHSDVSWEAHSEGILRKLYGGDEIKVKAGMKIRCWVRKCLLNRRQKKLASQLAALQSQHELMLTNPQHFQSIELTSLIEMLPLFSGTTNLGADPFRTLTEATDALLRSEIRRHNQISQKILDKNAKNEMRRQLQAVEAGRREILQVYAQRMRLMNTKKNPPVPIGSVPKSTLENQENVQVPEVTLSKPKVKRKGSSVRWADKNGLALGASLIFDSEDIVAPSTTV